MRIEEITLVVPTRNEERNIGAFLASLPQALPIIADLRNCAESWLWTI